MHSVREFAFEKVPVPLDVQSTEEKLVALAPAVMLKEAVVEHPDIFAPATAVAGVSTETFVVLKVEITVLQPAPEDRFVMVTVVVPMFKAGVVKVPVPGLPAVNVMVAVFPIAVVAPDKL